MITLILITATIVLTGLFCVYWLAYYIRIKDVAAITVFTINTVILLGIAIALTVKLFQDYT